MMIAPSRVHAQQAPPKRQKALPLNALHIAAAAVVPKSEADAVVQLHESIKASYSTCLRDAREHDITEAVKNYRLRMSREAFEVNDGIPAQASYTRDGTSLTPITELTSVCMDHDALTDVTRGLIVPGLPKDDRVMTSFLMSLASRMVGPWRLLRPTVARAAEVSRNHRTQERLNRKIEQQAHNWGLQRFKSEEESKVASWAAMMHTKKDDELESHICRAEQVQHDEIIAELHAIFSRRSGLPARLMGFLTLCVVRHRIFDSIRQGRHRSSAPLSWLQVLHVLDVKQSAPYGGLASPLRHSFLSMDVEHRKFALVQVQIPELGINPIELWVDVCFLWALSPPNAAVEQTLRWIGRTADREHAVKLEGGIKRPLFALELNSILLNHVAMRPALELMRRHVVAFPSLLPEALSRSEQLPDGLAVYGGFIGDAILKMREHTNDEKNSMIDSSDQPIIDEITSK